MTLQSPRCWAFGVGILDEFLSLLSETLRQFSYSLEDYI